MRAPRWKALFSSSDHAPNHVRARATLGAGAHLCCTRPALSTSEPATPRCSTQYPPRLSYGVRSTVHAACICTARAVATAVRTICASKFASVRALHKAHGARLGFQAFVERLAQENESWTQEILFRPQSEFVLHGRIADDAESAISVTWLLCTERLSNDWEALQRALPALRKFALPSKPQRASAPSEALQTALDTPTPRTLHILEEDPFFTSDNHLWNRHCVVTAQCCVLHQGLG